MNTNGITGHQAQIRYLDALLKKDEIYPAIIFTGVAGIGKKIIARRFISAFFCRDENAPCLSCAICRQIENDVFPDFIELSPNEKGIIPIGSEEGSEEGSVRWLIDRLSMKSLHGRTGVIIDGVESIGEEGQNALLKTIEEPASGTHFVLISSNKNVVLPTILSRALEIRFFPLSDAEMTDLLDIFGINNDLNCIARISGGSIEIATKLSDMAILEGALDFCRDIALFFKSGFLIDFDISGILKKITVGQLLDIVISIYRQNLLFVIDGGRVGSYNGEFSFLREDIWKDVFIDDYKKVVSLLRVLFILKKKVVRNINIRSALKGLLYSLDSGLDSRSDANLF